MGPTTASTTEISIQDLTSRVRELKESHRFPQGTIQTLLSEHLKNFVASTKVDLNILDIIDPIGKMFGCRPFVDHVIKTNNMFLAKTFTKALGDPTFISEEVHPKSYENASRRKRDTNAEQIRITMDLRKPKYTAVPVRSQPEPAEANPVMASKPQASGVVATTGITVHSDSAWGRMLSKIPKKDGGTYEGYFRSGNGA